MYIYERLQPEDAHDQCPHVFDGLSELQRYATNTVAGEARGVVEVEVQ